MDGWYTIQSHDNIIDMFVNATTLILNCLVHPRPKRCNNIIDHFLIHTFKHGRETGYICEKDGDKFALLWHAYSASHAIYLCQFFPHGYQYSICNHGS